MTPLLVLGICALVLLILLLPFRRSKPAPAISTSGGGDAQAASHPTFASTAPGDLIAGDGERAALLHEKDRLLQALADLRFDYEAGKLTEADFELEDARLRERAAAVLEALDGPRTL